MKAKYFHWILAFFACLASVNSSSAIVDKTYDSNFQILLVREVEFGKSFSISQGDLSQQKSDRTSNGNNSNLEIRFSFTDADQQKIVQQLEGGFAITNRPEITLIQTEDNTSYVSSTEYALVRSDQLANGALTAAGPRSTTTNNGQTSSVYRIQDLRNTDLTGRIPIFEMQLSTAQSFQGNFDLVFNFFSADEEITGSLGNNQDQEEGNDVRPTLSEAEVASNSEDIEVIAGFESRAFKDLIEFNFVCNEDFDGLNELNICSTEGLDQADTIILDAIGDIKDSMDQIERSGTIAKGFLKEKKVTKKQTKNLLARLRCAFRMDRSALKKLTRVEKTLEKIRKSNDELNKAALTLKAQKLLSSARTKIQDAYIKCKKRFAENANSFGYITNESKDKFDALIINFDLTELIEFED